MKSLQQGVIQYLEYRRSLGFKLQFDAHLLPDFVSFMKKNQAKHITIKLALAFATINPGSSSSWAKRLGIIRCFAAYWSAIDPKTEVPPKNLLPHVTRRPSPYIYTDKEIIQLLICSECGAFDNPFVQHTYFCLFGLLAVTGMRVGEALALKCEDIDLHNGVITIHQGKFNKSRYIPIHISTMEILQRYMEHRTLYFSNCPSSYFFIDHKGNGLKDQRVRQIFHMRLKKIGLTRPKKHHRTPRIIDFRHTMAVKTLLRWYEQDVTSIDNYMPLLSTYLGHVQPSSTYWYLTATPELLKLVVSRFKKYKK